MKNNSFLKFAVEITILSCFSCITFKNAEKTFDKTDDIPYTIGQTDKESANRRFSYGQNETCLQFQRQTGLVLVSTGVLKLRKPSVVRDHVKTRN